MDKHSPEKRTHAGPSSSPLDGSSDGRNATPAAILHHSDDAIISYDLQGNITSWNASAERLFGYSANEILSEPIAMLIPPHKREEALDAFRRLQSGERVGTYETVRRRKDGSLVDVSLTMSVVKDQAGRIVGVSKIIRDITETVLALHQQSLLLREMQHRTRNLAAVLDALGRSALPKNEPTTEKFFTTFMGRARSLLSAGEMVVASPTRVAELGEIAKVALHPFMEGRASRIRMEGPPLLLREQTAGGLALAFHELGTNALKYGALKDPEGSIDLTWNLKSQTARIVWKERVHRALSGPERTGFGSQLIKSAIASERNGKAAMNFFPDGLECVFEFRVPTV